MAKKPMEQAIAATRDEATGPSYASRYKFTMDNGGGIVPRNPENAGPAILSGVRMAMEGDEVVAYVPGLASGMAGINPGFWDGDWQSDTFGNWEQAYGPLDGKQDIRRAMRWWRRDPLVFKCVKTLAQLANSTLTVECEDPEFRDLVTNWVNKAMPHSFRKAWFLEYYRSSMVPTLKTLIPYVPRDYKNDKAPKTNKGNVEIPLERACASAEKTEEVLAKNAETFKEFTAAFGKYTQAMELHKQGLCSEARLKKLLATAASVQYRWLKGNIAGAYTILDPLMVDMLGPDEMPWMRQPYLHISGMLQTAVHDPTPQQADILSKLPLDIVQQIKAGHFRVWLSPNICSVVFGEKQPYERYPVPIACHAEEALELKYMLLQMDRATAKSVRDKVLKITIGNDKYPEFDANKLKALSKIFLNPARNLTVFWNHTLNMEWVQPDNTLMGDQKKYAHVNDEIRTCFGIASILTGTNTGSGASSDGIMNLKGVEEEVDEAQDSFLEWFDKEVELLQQALGVKFKVTGEFDRMNLKDEETFMALLLQLYQNGLIDPQTAIETMRFNYPTIVKRLEVAIKLRKKGLFVPMPSSNNMGPDGTMVQKGSPNGPGKGGIGGGKSGKPTNQPKKANQQKAGTAQPKHTKTRASLIPDEDGVGCHLVVARILDAEEREQLAEQFMIPQEWIVTEDEYLKATGKRMDWLSPLPALDVLEFVDVMAKANTLVSEVDQGCEGAFEAIRSTGTGKRGKYVTDATKSDTRHTLAVALIAKLKPENVEEVEWKARHDRAVAEVASKSKAMKLDEDGTHLFAAAMVAHQYAKRTEKIAA